MTAQLLDGFTCLQGPVRTQIPLESPLNSQGGEQLIGIIRLRCPLLCLKRQAEEPESQDPSLGSEGSWPLQQLWEVTL